MQSVAACCCLLRPVAVCCGLLRSVAVCCFPLLSFELCCSLGLGPRLASLGTTSLPCFMLCAISHRDDHSLNWVRQCSPPVVGLSLPRYVPLHRETIPAQCGATVQSTERRSPTESVRQCGPPPCRAVDGSLLDLPSMPSALQIPQRDDLGLDWHNRQLL